MVIPEGEMDFPLQFTMVGLPHDPNLDALVRRKVADLDRRFGHLVGVRVGVERAARHRGVDAYRVRILLSVEAGRWHVGGRTPGL